MSKHVYARARACVCMCVCARARERVRACVPVLAFICLLILIYHFAEPAVPGELKPGVHAAPNVTLTFTASEGNVERYEVAVTNQTGFTNIQTITTPAVTFTGLEAGQTYDVQIVAISGGLRSDTRHDSFMVAADREFDSVTILSSTMERGKRSRESESARK